MVLLVTNAPHGPSKYRVVIAKFATRSTMLKRDYRRRRRNLLNNDRQAVQAAERRASVDRLLQGIHARDTTAAGWYVQRAEAPAAARRWRQVPVYELAPRTLGSLAARGWLGTGGGCAMSLWRGVLRW